MSVPAIEARSLSSLTALASNPPSYPRNPTHGKHEPLTLYIARVPGSRDVFLSPMKPREKVVTAEDIQTSLYFVHVDHPEDDGIVNNEPSFQEPDYSGQQPGPPNHSQTPAIPRKAVPNPSAATVPTAPQRKPVSGMLAPTAGFENRQNVAAADYARLSAGHLGPDYTPRRSFESMQHQNENRRPSLPPQDRSGQPYLPGTSLTLIRRDPASGAQWNIACIQDPLSPEVYSSSSNSTSTKRPIGAPMFIDITNPGYSKFLNPEPGTIPSRETELFDRSSQANVSVPHDVRVLEISGIFRRRLWMEGANDPSGGFGHRRFNSHESNMSAGSPRNSFEGLQRSSADIRPVSPRKIQPHSSSQVSGKQTSFRGYVFMSPWNGRCEFSTGAGGGSLKCQHVVPGLQGSQPVALPVSELRFNLPSTSKIATPKGEESSKRSSIFHRPRHSRHNSAVTDTRGNNTRDVGGAFERLDLSLGQEFAGGGFGGKDAKLGKLIIGDEGLKMVDLLVAANVALWWRAYDKYDTKVKSNRGAF